MTEMAFGPKWQRQRCTISQDCRNREGVDTSVNWI